MSGAGTTVVRSIGLGKAAGLRSTWGVAGPVLSGEASSGARVAVVAALLGETVGDKHPAVPDRLSAMGLAPRLLSGALGAATLARRTGVPVVLPALAGVTGAAVGAVVGRRWRTLAGQRIPDWQAALVEDVVAAALAVAACRRTG
jgi:uncharacterized membrane protein